MPKSRVLVSQRVHIWLFVIGLLVELVSIMLVFNQLDVTRPVEKVLITLGLLCLLVHQYFIFKTFEKVDEDTQKCHVDEKYCTIGSYTNDSKFEYMMRWAIFVLLAAVSGEIPYLLFTIALKLDVKVTPSLAALIFACSTSVLCLAVIIWDLIILSHRKLNGYKLFYGFKGLEFEKFVQLNMIWVWLFCDILSFFMWLMINISLFDRENNMVTNISYISALYACLIGVRLFSKILQKLS